MAHEKKWIFVSRLFFPIFNCVEPDPYSENGSTKLQNTDPIWIQIHNTGYQGFENCWQIVKKQYNFLPVTGRF